MFENQRRPWYSKVSSKALPSSSHDLQWNGRQFVVDVGLCLWLQLADRPVECAMDSTYPGDPCKTASRRVVGIVDRHSVSDGKACPLTFEFGKRDGERPLFARTERFFDDF